MDVSVAASEPTQGSVDVWFVTLFEGELKAPKKPPALSRVEASLLDILRKSAEQEGFAGKVEQTFVLHTHGKLPQDRLVLLGLGDRKKLTSEAVRQAAGRAAKLGHR